MKFGVFMNQYYTPDSGFHMVDEHEVKIDYDELEEKYVIRSPGGCIEQLWEYEKLGIDQVDIGDHFPGQSQETTLETLERFGDGVIPVFT